RGKDRGRREARLREPRRQARAARRVGQGRQRRGVGDEGPPRHRQAAHRCLRPGSDRRRDPEARRRPARLPGRQGGRHGPHRSGRQGPRRHPHRLHRRRDGGAHAGRPARQARRPRGACCPRAARYPRARRAGGQARRAAAVAPHAPRRAASRGALLPWNGGSRQALMRIFGWAASDVGRKRAHNEDSFLCNNDLRLYAVADGMGGHLGGERASRMAVEILEREIDDVNQAGLLGNPPPKGTTGLGHPVNALLRRAVIEADRNIYETAMANPELSGMGTTLTALLFSEGYVHLSHVGDSRAYLYRDGRARQLTEDHSWIQEQVRAGLISPEEAKESRFRNIITRSVGFEPSVEPDLAGIAVLTGHFYRDAAGVFVDLANQRGGDDNVTCLVVYAGNELVAPESSH